MNEENFKLYPGQKIIEIGDRGTIRRIDGHEFLTSGVPRVVCLRINNKRSVYSVHRLMWETFMGPCKGKVVMFKNGDKEDLRMDNLEIGDSGRRPNPMDGMHGRVGISKRTVYSGDLYMVRRDGRYLGSARSKEDAIEIWEKNESKKERLERIYNEKYK